MRHFTRMLGLSALLWAGCSKDAPQPPPRVATAEVERMTEEEFARSIPHIGGVEGYIGSDSCKECHADQFESWHRSYHRTMTQLATNGAVRANFDHVTLTNRNIRYDLSERDGEYWVRAEFIDRPEVGASELRLGLVTGSHHMQVFWLPEGHGNMQIGFPFTWLIPEERWVPRNSSFIRPPDMAHRPEVWNIVCSRCHTTGVEPHADVPARRFETRVAELGISCEACHGPAKHHVEVQIAARSAPGPKTVAPGEIVQPERLDPVRASQVCGFCHSMKWFGDMENWREKGFTYRPGDDLEATTPIIRPSQVEAIEGLVAYLSRTPEILDDFFWPDGMIRVSGREYNGLIESPCYKGGKFSCLSCHSMHDSEPADQLKARAKTNTACTQCHERFREPAAVIAHTRHSIGSPGSECYNCHMPHTTYGVLKAIRSHQVSSPRVADELASGRPNACNLCHLDKSLDWTASYLRDWFNQPKPELNSRNQNVSRTVELALTGDAAQRVIAAWHLGWPAAWQASGKEWVPAILAQLLDDPYAAIRCVAERALKQFPDLLPETYDYTVDPRDRVLVRGGIWSRWKDQLPEDIADDQFSPLLLSPNDLAAQSLRFERYLIQRENRPVRLRE